MRLAFWKEDLVLNLSIFGIEPVSVKTATLKNLKIQNLIFETLKIVRFGKSNLMKNSILLWFKELISCFQTGRQWKILFSLIFGEGFFLWNFSVLFWFFFYFDEISSRKLWNSVLEIWSYFVTFIQLSRRSK